MNSCLKCKKPTSNPKFCSKSCAAKINNRKTPKRSKGPRWTMGKCGNCHREFEYKKRYTAGKYCSPECSAEGRKKETVNEWLSGKRDLVNITHAIKNYLRKQAGNMCSECGWNKKNPTTGKCPLEIHHLDGNSENNTPENLQVLCPNCHSLTESWKALNSGNASSSRRNFFAKHMGSK